uniref:Uncharacterized protein n=1 Tax=Octopus bimaculoides TaxID=37653 RepID=A0A0L8GWI3_OCTBM
MCYIIFSCKVLLTKIQSVQKFIYTRDMKQLKEMRSAARDGGGVYETKQYLSFRYG